MVGAVAILLVVLGGVAIPIPSLVELSGAAWPLPLVAPVVIAIVLGWALSMGDERFERVSARPLGWLDVAYVTGVTASFMATMLAVELTGLTDLGRDAARNAMGFVGMMLVGRALLPGDSGAVMPVVYIVLAAFFGGATRESAEPWAWLVRPIGDAHASILAAGLFTVGCALLARGVRRIA